MLHDDEYWTYELRPLLFADAGQQVSFVIVSFWGGEVDIYGRWSLVDGKRWSDLVLGGCPFALMNIRPLA